MNNQFANCPDPCACTVNFCYNKSMKNTHLEHPEDAILSGDLSVIDFLTARDHKVAIKWDGSPALVWGACPKTGKFFVGTKSVFNKVKVKINYTHADIERNHGDGPVACILHTALECLPAPNSGYVQGDFIGFGSGSVFKPQLIEYVFKKTLTDPINVVAHTHYEGDFSNPSSVFSNPFPEGYHCIIGSPEVSITYPRHQYLPLLAKGIARFAKFPSAKSVAAIKKHCNKFIREQGEFPSARVMYDSLPSKYKGEVNVTLFRLYLIVSAIKMRLLNCVNDTDSFVECRIMGKPTPHEGFVLSQGSKVFKLVDRNTFSHLNFTTAKSWK